MGKINCVSKTRRSQVVLLLSCASFVIAGWSHLQLSRVQRGREALATRATRTPTSAVSFTSTSSFTPPPEPIP